MAQIRDDVRSALAELKNEVVEIKTEHKRVMTELFNGDDGRTGLAAEFRAFVTRADERDQVRSREHEVSNRRYNLLIAVGTIASVLLGMLVWLQSTEAIHKGVIKLPDVGSAPTLAVRTSQDAKIPPVGP